MREPPENGIIVDAAQFPIVLVWFGRTYTDTEWTASLGEISELVYRGVPFVVLNVSRPDMDTPTARQRKEVADWNTEYVAAGHQTILGWGNVISSHVLRGVITAITWLTTFPYERKIVSNLEDGMAWAQQLVAHDRR